MPQKRKKHISLYKFFRTFTIFVYQNEYTIKRNTHHLYTKKYIVNKVLLKLNNYQMSKLSKRNALRTTKQNLVANNTKKKKEIYFFFFLLAASDFSLRLTEGFL